MPSLLAFVAYESKSNLGIFSTSLIKKPLFRDISCNFLVMVFISTESFSLSLNKLGNSFKGALSGLRQLLATESPLQIMKNAFYVHLESSLRSQDI